MPYIIAGYGVTAGLGATGEANDPFGGIGGFKNSEETIRKIILAGGDFVSPPGKDISTITSDGQYQIGTFNGEGYVYVQCTTDGKFYKFHMPGTGLGYWEAHKLNTDTARRNHLRAWFNAVVKAARAARNAAGVVPTPTPGTPPGVTPPDDVEEAGTGSGTTALIVGVAVAIAGVVLLKGRKGSSKGAE